ncbi:MAG: hypothetical protein WBX00_26890 [Isosphaeraceae bacterium]
MRSSAMSARLALLAVLTTGVIAHAQDDAARCACLIHRLHNEGTPPPGKPRDIPHTDERAGWPRALAEHLQPSTTPGGIGYYVGGGVPLGHGQPRRCDEGTWGWDETGCHLLRHRNILGWSHGRRFQGGTGAYAPDGPPIPDYIYGITSSVNSLRR